MSRLLILFCILLHSFIFSVSTYAHSPFPKLNYNQILSTDEEHLMEITNTINNFDFNAYQIHNVPTLGLFFLEANGKRDWIKDELRSGKPWESYIAQYIEAYAKPGTIALDVGSHIGTHTFTMSRAVGKNGRVIAFDPQPKTISELFMNCHLNRVNNVYCFWGALGNRSEEILLPKFHPEVEVTYIFDFTYGESTNTAPMITLDSLNLNNVSFMKVDVDGCDDIFLDGAAQTILRNRPVIVMEIMGGYDYDTAEQDIKDKILHTQKKLMELGYYLARISTYDFLAIPY